MKYQEWKWKNRQLIQERQQRLQAERNAGVKRCSEAIRRTLEPYFTSDNFIADWRSELE